MHQLECTPEELGVLREVLEHCSSQMEVEVLHTDTHDFRLLLKHRREVLERILAKLPAVSTAG